MRCDAHSQYLDSSILSAEPAQLVQVLFDSALLSIEKARRYLAEGDIAARGHSITKAYDIIGELRSSLDMENGRQIGRNLGGLYGFMQKELLRAHLEQSDECLVTVHRLLAPLAEAWSRVGGGAWAEIEIGVRPLGGQAHGSLNRF